MNNSSKKTIVIIAAIIAVIFAVIAVRSVIQKHKGEEIVPPLEIRQEPVADDPFSKNPTPVDYTGTEFTFSDDMPDVMLSHNHFFYTDSLTVRIFSRKTAEIRYTLDGSTPTKNSLLYSSENGIPLYVSPFMDKFYPLRAIAFYKDGTHSEEIVHSYFISSDINNRYENMLVFSISGEPEDLTEGPSGILYGNNYEIRGEASERPVYVEVLNRSGELITSQYLGVRINGAYSRMNSQKSLKFFARKRYSPEEGTTYLNCFNLLAPDGSQIVRYDRFVLRAGGNDFRFGFCRDELNQMLAKDAGFDIYEPVFPAVAYINGVYYGYFWLHASYCDEYFKNLFGASPAAKAASTDRYEEGEFVILAGSERHKEMDEDDAEKSALAKEFNEDYEHYAGLDMTKDTNYEALNQWLDVDGYLSYMAYNIYLCNKDWPNNNIRCFRYYTAPGEHYEDGYYDGRWHYVLHDIDYTLGLYEQPQVQYDYDTLAAVLSSSDDRYAPLFAALMKRDDCKEFFIRKSLDFAAGALSYSSIVNKLNAISESRTNEMHYYYDFLTSLNGEDVSWIQENQLGPHLQQIRDFAEKRPNSSADYLRSNFDLSGKKYNLIVTGTADARLQVGSYTAKEGVNVNAVYLTDFDVPITAHCPEGTAFDYWEVNGVRVDTEAFTVTAKDVPSGAVSVVLHTKKVPQTELCITEFRSRAGDYVVISNPTDTAVDMTGYVLSDGKYDYIFQNGDTVSAGQSITVYGNDTSVNPAEERKAIFNLSEGETLSLKKADGTVITEFTIPASHYGFLFRRNSYTGLYEEVQH